MQTIRHALPLRGHVCYFDQCLRDLHQRRHHILPIYFFPLLLIIQVFPCFAQEHPNNKVDRLIQLPNKLFGKIDREAGKMESELDRETEKYLKKLERQEQTLRKKMAKENKAAAEDIFGGSDSLYASLRHQLSDSVIANSKNNYYAGHLDSLRTSLHFINQHSVPISLGNTPSYPDINKASSSLKILQNKFNQSDAIRRTIQQRKEYLKAKFQSLGMVKELKKYRQQVYYYQQQVEEYRNMLNDPEKLGAEVLKEVTKIPAFANFFQQNSQLAALFPMPANYGTVQSLAGLQTRAQIQQLVQGQISTAGAQNMVQQNIQQAQGLFNQFKEKITKLGNSGGDVDMPDFKPNPQKTKAFLQRLEYGTTIQTQHANYYFPTTTDMALTVGYRFNDKLILGFGASYKMGWGKDFQHVAISNQGMGIRSYGEWKLKGTFYASGGFEYNYQQPFSGMQEISSLHDWTKSGLIGISKIISVKSKVFKKTKVQLLWDFLSYYQQPVTNPLKFRVGYNF